MTFNAGTNALLGHDGSADDGYTSKHARITDALYRDNLSWNPAEAALISFLERIRPDIVGFQEMWHDPWCEEIDVDPSLDFVCQGYDPGRALQIERLLGPDYHTACAPKQVDNCVGVRKDLGVIVDGEVWGIDTVDSCSGLGRVGAFDVRMGEGADQRTLRVVNVHARSGITQQDMGCRTAQLKQVFEDFGDGDPAAGRGDALVFGDMNVDPEQWIEFDPSAAYWNEWVGSGQPSKALTGPTPTHRLGTRLDHVIGRGLDGACVVHGEDEGSEPVMQALYWDHRPVVCEVNLPPSSGPGVQGDDG